MTTDVLNEISQGERFAFGANWARFLRALNEEHSALIWLLSCWRKMPC